MLSILFHVAAPCSEAYMACDTAMVQLLHSLPDVGGAVQDYCWFCELQAGKHHMSSDF